MDEPYSEKPAQLNTNRTNKDKSNTDLINIHQSIPHSPTGKRYDPRMAKIDMDGYREIIKENIDYECMIQDFPYKREIINELIEIMVDAVTTTKDYLYVNGEPKASAIVKSILLSLNSTHIDYVLECLGKNSTDVRNIKSYLLTTLYNAPITIDHYYQSKVNHDLRGS
jgi:hypothetical protein